MSSTRSDGDFRPEGVMDAPELHAADDERMPRVRPDAVDALAEVEAVQPLAVRLVVLEADERQRANVDRLALAVRLHDRQRELEGAGLRGLEAEAVAVVFAGDVAREGVEAVGPPEAGAFVLVERQHLLAAAACRETPARPGCGRGRCRPRCRLRGRSRGRRSGSRRNRGRRDNSCREWSASGCRCPRSRRRRRSCRAWCRRTGG